MKTYQDFANGLITLSEAQLILGYKSRNALEYQLDKGTIKYVTIGKRTTAYRRFVIKKSVEEYLNNSNGTHAQ